MPILSTRSVPQTVSTTYDKAIADYTEAIRLNPEFAAAFHNRGETWLNKGEFDKALADLTEAIRLNPNNERSFNNRGNI